MSQAASPCHQIDFGTDMKILPIVGLHSRLRVEGLPVRPSPPLWQMIEAGAKNAELPRIGYSSCPFKEQRLSTTIQVFWQPH